METIVILFVRQKWFLQGRQIQQEEIGLVAIPVGEIFNRFSGVLESRKSEVVGLREMF